MNNEIRPPESKKIGERTSRRVVESRGVEGGERSGKQWMGRIYFYPKTEIECLSPAAQGEYFCVFLFFLAFFWAFFVLTLFETLFFYHMKYN